MTKVNKEVEIEKTYRDMESRLYQAVSKQINRKKNDDCCYSYVWLRDWDDDFVYVSDDGEDYRYSYTKADDEMITIDLESGVEGELITNTSFSPKRSSEDMEKQIESSVLKFFKKHFGGSTQESEPVEKSEEVMVIKQFDEEEMIAYEPLYTPPNTPDGHGEAMTADEIVNIVKDINELIAEGAPLENLSHGAPIKNAWKYQEAFVSPWPECLVGDTVVKKGQPVLVVKYNNERAWELRKEGRIKGPSIGGTGVRVEVDDE